MSQITIKHGDNINLLKELADSSIDSVVTDAPYGLGKEPDPVKMIEAWLIDGYMAVKGKGFMGKSWDSFVPQPVFWKEVFRVLKPGGHVVCFFGTRTYDWGTLAIRLAGFEIRDMITWHYGSGFPKSLDVSKAIDKDNGKYKIDLSGFGDYIKLKRLESRLSKSKLDYIMGTNTSVSWWEGRGGLVQLPSKKMYSKLKEALKMDDRFDYLIDWAEAEREITGKKEGTILAVAPGQNTERGATVLNVTIPKLETAKQWEGYGTALKPATEPICLARKPLIGSVAQNILEHGTGGINIDGCRIEFESEEDKKSSVFGRGTDIMGGNYVGAKHSTGQINIQPNDQGRFPANVILDEYTASLMDEQTGVLTSGKPTGQRNASNNIYGQYGTGQDVTGFGDSGGASRFFYCAKASQEERHAGLKQKATRKTDDGRTVVSDNAFQRGNNERQNFHPTVKPISLMRWLIRLVTPKGGVCIDPFAGSGTTGCAAAFEDVDIILMEAEQDYILIIEDRTAYWQKQANREKYIQQLKDSVQTLF